jgi:extracellular elastinolytic metalloproteinase
LLSRRAVPSLLLCGVLLAAAIDAAAQNIHSRAYRRPTISKGSPAKPLTGPSAGRPSEVALEYLRANGKDADLAETDLTDVILTSETKTAHNGITHVYLRQRVQGIEVFGAESNFNVGADGAVLSFGTSFLPDVELNINRSSPILGAAAAVLAAAAHVGLVPSEPVQPVDVKPGPDQETILTTGGIASSPIAAKLVYQPVQITELRLAWQVDIDEVSGQHLWRMTVDAETGEVLNQEDWVLEDNWDDPVAPSMLLSKPAGGPGWLERGMPLVSPTAVFDGSSYRVFALPMESPNDGPQSLVSNPADDQASPHGWHDTNGLPGAEFTITRGNNVHAYLDQDNNNAADFGDTDGGPALTFDHPADLNEHAQNYRDAAVTNLFYWNNIFHDVMWRYGFTESAGNFQANNYLRGGTQGDYVRAEAADGGGTNNANFSTPVETLTSGGTPRMQMYLWPGTAPVNLGPTNQVVVNGLGSFDGTWSRFGRAPSVAGTSGQIINAGNGCTAADYAGAPSGDWIAIVTGNNTGCQNIDKTRQAATAGAKAVIVAHTTATAPILTGSQTTAPPMIPVVSINLTDGNSIRSAIAAGATTGTVRKHPNHPGIRDGDFENGIIIHEYTHGVSNRLTGGPATNCLTGNEQAGEGWSDWYALTVLLNPALDDPEGPRGLGPYALFQNSRQGTGIRPRPYSRNMNIQPFTYDSIKSSGWLSGGTLAAPHGIGHGWAAVLWDLTWDLIDKHGFNADIYAPWHTGGNNRALQYVTDGLKLQGCAPGFVAARDAIVAAAEALDPGDVCTVWASFARRGLGYSAVQGTTGRDDNTEAFDTHPGCRASFGGSVATEPAMNVVNVGATLPLTFSYPGASGLNVLAKNSPYSRQVECSTLRTLDPNAQFITPRPLPILMQSPGGSGLSFNQGSGRYTFTWKTDPVWAGSCREAVLTRNDGVQHRAYFFFDSGPSHPVSGYVRDASGNPVPNATVRIAGSAYGAVTTNGEGFYSFPSVATGTYTATATPAGAGCVLPQTREFTVSRPTTLDFVLPTRTDAFGYSCRNETAAFDEAATVVPIIGNTGVDAVDLPFPFTFYGQTYNRVYVCTNGFVEFAGPGTTNCSSSNGTIPGTARPNGAIYPFWDDLFVDALASIRTELKGTAPNRRFVIEFRNLHFSGDISRRVDFNTILLENGQVLMQHRNIADDGRERGNSATIGIEMHTGTVALMYSLNTAALTVEPGVTTIRYTPPPLFTVSGQVRDADGNPVEGATVTLQVPQFTLTATVNAAGNYSFPGVPGGTYTATARAGGCSAHAQIVVVSGNTTANFTLSEQPDAFGYRCRLENASFEEASTLVPITGTSGVDVVNLPFPFTVYGQTYNQVYVCANGFVEFVGPATTNCSSANGTIPGTGRPNGAIYPFWDDLVVDLLASIRTELKGTAPNRFFVIEFRNVHVSGNTAQRLDFNAVLFENGQILTQHRNIANDGRERGDGATMGIEMDTGTVALMYSLNTAVLRIEPGVTTIRYLPPPVFTVSGQVKDADGNAAGAVTVTLQVPQFTLTATTDAAGNYSFPAVPAGTYTATARAGGCSGHIQTVVVSGHTALNFQLGEIPDAFGYRCRLENTSFETASTATSITGTSGVGTIDLPFPFTFYGQTYTQVYACANGFIEFVGPSTTNCSAVNGTIPGTGRPNGAVYPFWDDLVVDLLASIRTEVKGTAPNRFFVIEFRNVHISGNTLQRIDFNAVLFENGQILTQHRNIANDVRERGSSATIGIDMHTGTVALMYSFNTAILAVEPAVTTIRYTPPPLFAVSGQVRGSSGTPVANIEVTLERSPFTLTTTTDSAGNYSFPAVPAGSYTATARAGGCSEHTQTVAVSGDTTVNFMLVDVADAFGYRCRFENAAFEEGSTIVPISGDDLEQVAGTIELGFPFTFYGQTYTDAHVCTNGYIEFEGPDTTSCVALNTSIPNLNRPNGTIYAFWDDDWIDEQSAILTELKGTAPNRHFVIEFRNARFFNDLTRRIDFNIVLFEDGRIMTQYRNLANDGRERGTSATIGIEDHTATIALQFSMNAANLPAEPNIASIMFRPPGIP